ncbi:hypothetical protein ACFW16_05650 [Inquilinus sp. NPDC058860]|uniref:hypothetical protein n=1 Tax=Inquilinus sp. NPDC058860 TaxID=3346652 RepID=UPI0036C0F5C6
MRSPPLRRLVGLLALLVFALALPLQASLGAPMAGCAPAHAAMDHDGSMPPCGDATGTPLKAAAGAPCAIACAPVPALSAQVAQPVDHGRVAHDPGPVQNRPGRVTAPDPFPPRPTVRA